MQSTVPPAPQGQPFAEGFAIALVEAAVVATDKVVAAEAPAVTATLLGLKLHVGRLCAPVGEVERAHVRFMVPA